MGKGDSKERIRTALLELLLDKPIDKVTVTEVVERAGVSRVTYYRSFYSLHEVIDEALEAIFSQVEEIVGQRTANPTPAERKALELATYRVLILYRDNVALLQPLLMGSLSFEVVERIYGLILRLAPIEVLEREERAVSASLHPKSVAQMRRHFLAGGMTTVIVDWLRDGCVVPTEDVLAFITTARG